jgi:transcriptional regulator with XRE-family HTH domain
MPEHLGDRIRKARRRCELSGAALARAIGTSRQHLHEIETNKTLDPGVLVVAAIADALQVSADYLLSGRAVPRRFLDQLDGTLPASPVWERFRVDSPPSRSA